VRRLDGLLFRCACKFDEREPCIRGVTIYCLGGAEYDRGQLRGAVLSDLPAVHGGVVEGTSEDANAMGLDQRTIQTAVSLRLRSTFLGAGLLGTSFSWWDFPAYVVGAVAGSVVVRGMATGE